MNRRRLLLIASGFPALWRVISGVLEGLGLIDTVQSLMQPDYWLYKILFWPPLGDLMTAIGVVGLVVVLLTLTKDSATAQRSVENEDQGSNELKPQITVEPRGDDIAALIVRNSGGTARFTGEGEFALANCKASVKRRRPFRLMWEQHPPVRGSISTRSVAATLAPSCWRR